MPELELVPTAQSKDGTEREKSLRLLSMPCSIYCRTVCQIRHWKLHRLCCPCRIIRRLIEPASCHLAVMLKRWYKSTSTPAELCALTTGATE